MTSLELKMQLIKDIDKECDDTILEKIQKYYRKLKKENAPCQYTLEQLNRQLDRAEKEAADGGGTEHDKFMSEVSTWL